MFMDLHSRILLIALLLSFKSSDVNSLSVGPDSINETSVIVLPGLGTVVGKVVDDGKSNKYEAFYGIPYGEPPTGENRFANFVPKRPWNDTIHATEPKPKCIQKNIFLGKESAVTGEEDCLYLNVYRPITVKEKLPVALFIHGGGYFAGNAHPDTYGPEKFMKTEKVILVLLQYRLGPFGFLSTDDSAAEGNQGLKDQAGALKFIKSYIQYFNGDPDMITLIGHAAGASSAHMHAMSPLSRGLFSQIVLLSGSAIAPYNEPTKNPLTQVVKLAEYVGIENSKNLSTIELITQLRAIDANKILEASDELHTHGIDPVVVFKTVIESAQNKDAFITKHPKEYSRTSDLFHVPVVSGFLEDDGSVRTLKMINDEKEIERFNSDFDESYALLLDVEKSESVLGKIVNFYLNGSRALTTDTFSGFQKSVSDRAFNYPFFDTTRDLLKASNESVYLYKFDRQNSISFSSLYLQDYTNPPKHGPVHGDDLLELFDYKIFAKLGLKPTGVEDTETPFLNFIINFVSGDMSHYSDHLCSTQKLETNIREGKFCPYTNFGQNVTVKDIFEISNMAFWDGLYPKDISNNISSIPANSIPQPSVIELPGLPSSNHTTMIELPGLGSVVGKVVDDGKSNKYEAFYGIPYGEPPTGENRFANFVPKRPWNDTIHATEPKPKCIQKNIFLGKESAVTGEEDCLYLNVYRPITVKEKLPVAVFIHGGGYFAGNAHPDTYGPEKFMKTEKVILVLLQYRLGPFGFLSTDDSAAEGNQGLKDQAGALKFIKSYIQYFNGDPDMITLIGHAAGASSAHMHAMSPLSRGLFSQIVLLSGSAIAPYNEPTKNPLTQVVKLAEYVGIENSKNLSTIELITQLRAFDANKILEASDELHTHGIDPVVVFKTVIESAQNKDAFITKHPKEYSRTSDLFHVPVVSGFLEDDGSVRTLKMINDEKEIERFNSDFDESYALLLDVEKSESVLGKIVNFYLNGSRALATDTFSGFQKSVSDRAFNYPFFDTTRDLLKASNESVYLYKFDRQNSISFSSLYLQDYTNPPKHGPVHGDDLLELFDYKIFAKLGLKPTGVEDTETPFLNFIINFVSGDMSHYSDHLCSTQKLETNIREGKFCPYTNFGQNVTVKDIFEISNMAFWDGLYPKDL